MLFSGTTNTPASYCSSAIPSLSALSVPWSQQTQFKLFGAYPLPWWRLQVSGVFQNLPGPQDTATRVYPNAQVAPSLGRNLSAGATATVAVALLPPYTLFERRFSQVDLRLTKTIPLKKARAQVAIDGYNLFNSAAVLATNGTFGTSWLTPTSILGARLVKLGVQLDLR